MPKIPAPVCRFYPNGRVPARAARESVWLAPTDELACPTPPIRETNRKGERGNMLDRGRTRCCRRALLGCALIVLITGCCYRPRHGVVVRGDWSLELNRVPWLVNRTQSLGEYSVPQDGCPAHGAPVGPAAGPGRCWQCGRLLGCGAGEAEGEAGDQAHSRFHPVPTRPVFQAPVEHYSPIAKPEGEPESGADDANRVQPGASGTPPPVKLIPAPAPDTEGGWNTRPSPDDGGASGATAAPGSS